MGIKIKLEVLGHVSWSCVPKPHRDAFQEFITETNRGDETVTDNVVRIPDLRSLRRQLKKENEAMTYQTFVEKLLVLAESNRIQVYVFS